MQHNNGAIVRGWDSVDASGDEREFVSSERTTTVADRLVDAFVALGSARRDNGALARIQEKYSLRSTSIREARNEINLQTLSALQDIVNT
jgi:hypothetical protein